MRFVKYMASFAILISPVFAQQGNMIVLSYSGAPTGTCGTYKYFAIDLTNGDFYDCFSGTWTKVNGGAAGSVSSVFGRTGAVVAASGDYTVAQVTGAAPLASPTFTGTVAGITATMVGLGSVTNDAQTKAAIVPNTVPSAAQILAGNAGGTAYAPVGISGDSSMTSAGVMTNTKINNTAFSALATGILKNTTGTGVPSIAAGSDLPTAIPIASVGSAGLSGTSPVTISAAGAIACATCVVASSPGVGIAHFAGSTQTATSSAVDLSSADASGVMAAGRMPALTGDVTNSAGALATTIAAAAVTGGKIASSVALAGSPTTTTQTCADSSTKISTTAFVQCPTTLATGTSGTLVAPREYFVCTGTCTITVPVPAAGYEFCVLNTDNVATVITLSAIGSSARYENTARTAYGSAGTGTFVSAGAVGDKVCLLGLDSTHYLTASFTGTWTAN